MSQTKYDPQSIINAIADKVNGIKIHNLILKQYWMVGISVYSDRIELFVELVDVIHISNETEIVRIKNSLSESNIRWNHIPTYCRFFDDKEQALACGEIIKDYLNFAF